MSELMDEFKNRIGTLNTIRKKLEDDYEWLYNTIFYLEREWDEAIAENQQLRRLLWLRHGCGISALYGDDGEMQCSACGVDFKRVSIENFELVWHIDNERRR